MKSASIKNRAGVARIAASAIRKVRHLESCEFCGLSVRNIMRNFWLGVITIAFSLIFTGQPVHAQSTSTSSAAPRFEIGAQFSSLSINPHSPICLSLCLVGSDRGYTEPGGGARLTYNLTDNIGFEAEANFFPREHREFTLFGLSGRNFQAQFGVKAGKRFKKIGVFGKFRPGFVSFSKVSYLVSTSTINFLGQQFTIGQFGERSARYFSTDLGGVVEFYPSRRIVTRVDLGDTIIRYGEIVVPGLSLSGAIQRIPPETKHNLQFSAGVGFRFK
jgi:hypothetical protein